jgi:hypothetical protein
VFSPTQAGKSGFEEPDVISDASGSCNRLPDAAICHSAVKGKNMGIIDFYNAVSSGNLEKVKKFSEEHNGQMPLNRNMIYAGQKVVPLPLIIALKKGHEALAEYLIANGADLDIVCQKYNQTPRDFLNCRKNDQSS